MNRPAPHTEDRPRGIAALRTLGIAQASIAVVRGSLADDLWFVEARGEVVQ